MLKSIIWVAQPSRQTELGILLRQYVMQSLITFFEVGNRMLDLHLLVDVLRPFSLNIEFLLDVAILQGLFLRLLLSIALIQS